jgi:hypothetical protein
LLETATVLPRSKSAGLCVCGLRVKGGGGGEVKASGTNLKGSCLVRSLPIHTKLSPQTRIIMAVQNCRQKCVCVTTYCAAATGGMHVSVTCGVCCEQYMFIWALRENYSEACRSWISAGSTLAITAACMKSVVFWVVALYCTVLQPR